MDRFHVDGIPCPESLRTPVVDLMVRHSSVRSFDPKRPLPEGLVTVLVAAAQSAPTASNLQTYSIVEMVDRGRKRIMAELVGNQAFVDQAPLFLVFCADISRLWMVARRRDYPFRAEYLDLLLTSSNDAAIACQNAAFAAESLGLGCCMVGNVRDRPREVSDLLGLPRGVFAVVGLSVGYPAHRNEVKPRLPQSVVLHRERYSTEGLEEGIELYDRRMAATRVYEGRRVKVEGITPPPELDTAPYGWVEHCARRLAAASHLQRDSASFLKEKGFVPE